MMLAVLADAVGSPVTVYFAIALGLPFLVTWLVSNFNARWPRKGEPPMVPHWIPWLGHAYSFLFNINGFGARVKKRFPKEGAATSVVGGRHYYTILDPKLASQIYRRPKVFPMEAFIIASHAAFGTPEADLNVLKMGIPGFEHESGYKDDGRRVWQTMSKMLQQHLSMEGSINMATTFLRKLTENLEKEFPKNTSSTDRISIDLRSFILKQYVMASVASLYGSHLVDSWPTICEDFWAYDEYTRIHLAQVPEILAPKAYGSRRKILNILLQWEKDARQRKDLEKMLAEDVEWDEYWGARLIHHRVKFATENGMSAVARASMALSLIWGQNANAIPIGLWTMIHSLVNPGVQQRVSEAIESCRKPDGGFDMHQVVTHKYLKSVFLESLRYGVAAPMVRVVLETTQVGQYTFHKGNVIHIASRILHMDDDVWSRGAAVGASGFWGERFLDVERDANGNIEEKTNAEAAVSKAAADPISLPVGTRSKEIKDRMLAFRAFGGGNHLCPGRFFALYEIVAGMSTLLTMFDIEVDQEALHTNGMPVVDQRGIGGLLPDRKFMVKMRRK
ncbi:conserved hypothetical protein [Coccidioides posadasii str. Silveira]|uniref:Cytochrome P450 family protein n=2 Tax=Coccidioides posadasii (strain RMSCC 757 / Silveira) TaxID=443226 RepID=E9DFA4_COCPS|nr:conserved hypothetical protein [Coccidioides posadasii str. Silveira]